MNIQDLKQVQLFRQHITNRSDKISVLRDLNGVQCQFMVNAFHALKIRCLEDITTDNYGSDIVKNWSVRGTVHIFAKEDLPVFLHSGTGDKYLDSEWRGYVHHLSRDWTLTPERQKYYAQFIVKKVSDGVITREDLKAACLDEGMKKIELDSMFDQWGGGMRELCGRGFLNYKVQEKKAYEICPPFTPMDENEAIIEQARRYFEHYAPSTIRDAAYYFGWTQTQTKQIMQKLPLLNIEINGKQFFYLNELKPDYPDIPKCVFLAGFDQLMLGYQKQDSIYLSKDYIRGIFNLAGIVMPPIMLNGNIVGRWRKKNKKITFEMFTDIRSVNKKLIQNEAERLYSDINRIDWKDL